MNKDLKFAVAAGEAVREGFASTIAPNVILFRLSRYTKMVVLGPTNTYV